MAAVGGGLSAGKALRAKVPRSLHAAWEPAPDRRDPVDVLRAGDAMRVPELLPIRYARMAQNPFTFFRGAAALMASDLAALPVTGVRTQICGDCHLLNFGAFGTPERNLVFDVNDFDETLPGAWEWDLKRLAASVAIAGRHLGLRLKERRSATLAAALAYRSRIRDLAMMHVLDVWYARLDELALAGVVRSAQERRELDMSISKARTATSAHAFPRITDVQAGERRFVDEPPITFHPSDPSFADRVANAFVRYREALPDDRKALFDRFRFVDAAFHVVGVGSVGTRCFIALFLAAGDDPLILQVKEAMASVFAPYAGGSAYEHRGERVVVGQHLMQAASDVFLGWGEDGEGHDFYVRQLRDMKTSANVEQMNAADLAQYAQFCGWALARAHARAGGVAAPIAGYLGNSAVFDAALADFAESYADQNARDYERLMAAIAAGGVVAAEPGETATPAPARPTPGLG